jgi:hypothetical protein
MTVEFHDFCGITPKREVGETIGRLERLGFFSVKMSRVGHQDTWLVNRAACKIGAGESRFIKYVVRHWLGPKRVLSPPGKWVHAPAS